MVWLGPCLPHAIARQSNYGGRPRQDFARQARRFRDSACAPRESSQFPETLPDGRREQLAEEAEIEITLRESMASSRRFGPATTTIRFRLEPTERRLCPAGVALDTARGTAGAADAGTPEWSRAGSSNRSPSSPTCFRQPEAGSRSETSAEDGGRTHFVGIPARCGAFLQRGGNPNSGGATQGIGRCVAWSW